MANVNIKFNNKDYLLSCDDGQEEDLKTLTRFLDKKYSALKDKLGNIGENKLLLITSIILSLALGVLIAFFRGENLDFTPSWLM